MAAGPMPAVLGKLGASIAVFFPQAWRRPGFGRCRARATPRQAGRCAATADTLSLRTPDRHAVLQEVKDTYHDVRRLEASIIELHKMFMDLALLVDRQGEMLDQIEYQVSDRPRRRSPVERFPSPSPLGARLRVEAERSHATPRALLLLELLFRPCLVSTSLVSRLLEDIVFPAKVEGPCLWQRCSRSPS